MHRYEMKRHQTIPLFFTALLAMLLLYTAECPAQNPKGTASQEKERRMAYYVEKNGDTVYYGTIEGAKIYAKIPKQRGTYWRRYYRDVQNFGKTYPYALMAKQILMETDSTIFSEDFTRIQRERFIRSVEKDLFARFEKPLRSMTVSQGKMLMKLIDREVGLRNTLFFIISTGYADADAPDLAKYRIPAGRFYPERCAALLNMYLNAVYGEGLFVEAYHGSQIYLNHEVIEKKQLDLPEVIGKSADFLIQFSGVSEVYTAYRLLLGAWTPEVYRVRNSFHRERSGDLLVDVLPGWTVVQEKAEETKVVRKACMAAPLVFFGWNVKPGLVSTPVNVGRIAPSLAGMMRIRAPNACSNPPLEDIRANKQTGLP